MKSRIILLISLHPSIELYIPAYVILSKKIDVGKDGRKKIRIFLDETGYYKKYFKSTGYIKMADYDNLMRDLVKYLDNNYIMYFYIISASNTTTLQGLNFISSRVFGEKYNYKFHYLDFQYSFSYVGKNSDKRIFSKLYQERIFGTI